MSYSPVVGRFLQRDPLGYVDGPNLYVYLGNAPTGLRDPEGLESCCEKQGPPYEFVENEWDFIVGPKTGFTYYRFRKCRYSMDPCGNVTKIGCTDWVLVDADPVVA